MVEKAIYSLKKSLILLSFSNNNFFFFLNFTIKTMNNFCDYYSKLTFEKKLLTILFCPCVTLYYLLYNLATQTLKFFNFIAANCLCPCLDCIGSSLSKCLEKICSFFDFIFEFIIRLLSRIFQFVVTVIERILSIFQPIFNCFSRIFSCFFTMILQFFQKSLLLLEAFGIFICKNLEACFKCLYQVFCQRICICLSDCLTQFLEFNKKYLINPLVRFMKRICFCFSDAFRWIYRSFIMPIKDYLLLPIYNCMMNYCFLVFFRVFQSLFHQIGVFFSAIFTAISGIFKDIWFLFRDLFANIFYQGRKRRVINPVSQQMKNGKSFERDDEDLENETMNKQYPEQIFCLNKDDLFSIK